MEWIGRLGNGHGMFSPIWYGVDGIDNGMGMESLGHVIVS